MDAGPNLDIFWDENNKRYVDVLYQDDYRVGDTLDVECNKYGTVESIIKINHLNK